MRTDEERLSELHDRIKARRRMLERRKTSVIGAACTAITACLLLLIFGEGKAHNAGVVGIYTGATMLFEGAGAYVLVAVLAFMIGTAVTLICLRRQKNRKNVPQKPQDEKTIPKDEPTKEEEDRT